MKRKIAANLLVLTLALGIVVKVSADLGRFGQPPHYREGTRAAVAGICARIAADQGLVLQGVDVIPGIALSTFTTDAAICRFDRGNVAWNAIYDLAGNLVDIK